jgi:hypothetical protein
MSNLTEVDARNRYLIYRKTDKGKFRLIPMSELINDILGQNQTLKDDRENRSATLTHSATETN